MPVRIQHIAARDLGPLQEFTMDLGELNLIYGWNETGKTYLVEFLLRSLFRQSGEWPLRDPHGQGKVTVAGLSEDPDTFSPDSDEKLENYWDEDGRGLPPSLARLLVVRGAEAAIVSDERGGLNRAVLKSLLSRDVLLDEILDDIPVTLQKASIHEGTLDADRRGDVKTREQLLDDRERIENLYAQIDEHYSGGPRRQLELEKESLEKEKELLLQAKRHLAYTIAQDISELEVKRDRIPEDELETLEGNHDSYQEKVSELERKETQLKSLQQASINYSWADEAIRIWESRAPEAASGPSPALLYLSGASLLGAAATLLMNLDIPALILFLLSAGLAALYVRGLRLQLGTRVESDELQRISEDFESRFGEELSSLPELKRRRDELQETHYKAKGLSEQCKDLRPNIEALSTQISGSLRSLTGQDHGPQAWRAAIDKLGERGTNLDKQIRQKELELASLGVDESNYSPEEPPREFDPDRLEEVEDQLEDVEARLQNAIKDLSNLKQAVCNETGSAISSPWSEILEQLRQKRAEVEADYKQVTADILAQITVSGILKEIKEAESERIREGLQSDYLSGPLYEITRKYTSMDMVNGQLQVSAEFGDYPLSELSTGAREQVLLAVRMGFASMLTGGEPLFFILDDAFQHSDWQRRRRLVEEIVNLANNGWQVTYLTMDDHLRDLVREAGEDRFGYGFSYKELEGDEDENLDES